MASAPGQFDHLNAGRQYFQLDGQIALVTGASSGLGRHFAHLLAANGCIVGIAARRADRLDRLKTEIEAAGGRAVKIVMDVTDAASVETGVNTLHEAAGPCSILVNNAGIAVTQNFLDADEHENNRVFDVNQNAVWRVAQQVCRRMRDNGGGSVINIASIAGVRQFSGAASYVVSKAAVVQLTKVMALELARHKIRVNAIAPGYFATEMNAEFLTSEAGKTILNRSPMRRAGNLDELNGALLLLASERGSFMTGAVLPVDGGHLVSTM